MPKDYAYYKNALNDKPLPAAFVDLDLLDENIRAIIPRAGGKKIRVASKSVRSVAILRRIMQSSPVFQGLMTFTAAEAVYLSQQGFDDLLMGYPVHQGKAITDICNEIRKGKKITLMVDSAEHINLIDEIAAYMSVNYMSGNSEPIIVPICFDIDMSVDFPGLHFGVWRSPLTSAEAAVELYEKTILRGGCGNVKLTGIMGYEAQIAGVGDNMPGQGMKNRVIRLLKQRSLAPIAERRAAVVKALQERGADLQIVNGGGTGSLESTSTEPAVTEVTVGSGFYCSTLFDNYVNFKHQPAAGFAIEIVRQPKPGIYTCHGGGYIASGSVGTEKQPQPYLPTGAKLTSLEGAGEVQTPIVYSGSERLSLGDPILMRHSKAGELCERFNTLLLISDGKVVDEVTTYRGDGKAFL